MSRLESLLRLGQSRSACSANQLVKLASLVCQFKDVPGDIVEIGSYKCGSTITLAAASELYSPNKKVFAFDTFSGMPNVSEFDQHKPGTFGDISLEEIKKVVEVLPNIHLIQGRHEDTIPSFSHNPISLLFLDSDLYWSHFISLRHFWPDISENGVMILHDWNTADCPGVRKAMVDFFGYSEIKSVCEYSMLIVQK